MTSFLLLAIPFIKNFLIIFLTSIIMYLVSVRQFVQIIVCAIIIYVGYRFLRYFKDSSKLKNLYMVSAVIYSFVCTLLVIEMFFIFYARSSGFGHSYAAQNWFFYHWKHNEFGFRDDVPKTNIPESIKKIIFVGDSFTAGHGVEVEKRFSTVVAQSLGSNYQIYNIGRNGNNTLDELNDLQDFVVKDPDIVVLQWFVNDIQGYVSTEHLNNTFSQMIPSNFLVKLVVENSYLVNFVFYQYIIRHVDDGYINLLYNAYENSEIFSSHLNELNDFIFYADENKFELIAVVFPNMYQVDLFKSPIDNIVKNFRDHGIKTVDVRDVIQDMPLKTRIVNMTDGHPSVLLHKVVAEEILSIILK